MLGLLARHCHSAMILLALSHVERPGDGPAILLALEPRRALRLCAALLFDVLHRLARSAGQQQPHGPRKSSSTSFRLAGLRRQTRPALQATQPRRAGRCGPRQRGPRDLAGGAAWIAVRGPGRLGVRCIDLRREGSGKLGGGGRGADLRTVIRRADQRGQRDRCSGPGHGDDTTASPRVCWPK